MWWLINYTEDRHDIERTALIEADSLSAALERLGDHTNARTVGVHFQVTGETVIEYASIRVILGKHFIVI